MSLRSKSREFAMQMIFQWDMSQQNPVKLEATFWKSAKAADSTRLLRTGCWRGLPKSWRCSMN